MSSATARPVHLPAATVAVDDVVRRAGRWRRVVRISAGVGLFDGLLELHTEGPYTRPWPCAVDQQVPVLVEPDDVRVAS